MLPRSIRVCRDVAYVPITMGKEAIIDASDVTLVQSHNWSLYQSGSTGYAKRSYLGCDGKQFQVLMHRVITCAGDTDIVDHINGNGLDNRRSNLRIATKNGNQQNATRRRDNTSGHKGVCWHKGDKRWHAKIQVDGKRVHLGQFDTLEKAMAAYENASTKHHGDYSNLG